MQKVKDCDHKYRWRNPDGDYPEHLFALWWRHGAALQL